MRGSESCPSLLGETEWFEREKSRSRRTGYLRSSLLKTSEINASKKKIESWKEKEVATERYRDSTAVGDQDS